MSVKEEILEICRKNIHREGFDEFLHWLETSDFFIAPASTRYHGNFEGGLAVHPLHVYRELKRLLDCYNLMVDPETVAIISLFHDICKVNYYKKSFRKSKDAKGNWIDVPYYEIDELFPGGEHADKSIIILQQFMQLTPQEILAIRGHMGGFDASVKSGSPMIGKIFEKCPLAVCLHFADMAATYFDEVKQ